MEPGLYELRRDHSGFSLEHFSVRAGAATQASRHAKTCRLLCERLMQTGRLLCERLLQTCRLLCKGLPLETGFRSCLEGYSISLTRCATQAAGPGASSTLDRTQASATSAIYLGDLPPGDFVVFSAICLGEFLLSDHHLGDAS